MVTKKTWSEFRKTGLLLFINMFLHAFGWAIVVVMDTETGEITNCYPARVKYRGFDEQSQDEAFKNLAAYVKENADDLNSEVNE